jgi:Protein of unknown function (DUF4236)
MMPVAFKFRRTLKIAPGLRLNLTHRGVSARVGTKGAGYTVNTDGSQHISAGIPGSGIHVSQQITSPRKRNKKAKVISEPDTPKASLGRIVMTAAMTLVFWGVVVLIIAYAVR